LLSIQDKKENTGVLDCLNKAATKFNNKQLDRIESSSQLNQLEIETKEKEIKSKSIQLENKIATYTNKIIDLLMQKQNELILALREQETKGLNQLEQCLKHKKQIDIKINETKSNITSTGSSNIDLKDIQNLIESNLSDIKLIDFDFVFVENSDLIDKISSIGKVINLNPKKTILNSNSSTNNTSVEAETSGITVITSNSKQLLDKSLSHTQIIKKMDNPMKQLKENIQSTKRIITTIKSAAIYNKITLEDLNPV